MMQIEKVVWMGIYLVSQAACTVNVEQHTPITRKAVGVQLAWETMCVTNKATGETKCEKQDADGSIREMKAPKTE